MQYPSGHSLTLLHGGADYFPALEQALDEALHEVWMETYIFENDASGQRIAAALARAAARGVRVRLTVDGFGTGKLAAPLRTLLTHSKVEHAVFSPIKSRLSMLLGKQTRRLHRKLTVIDGRVAFCGGINMLDDHYDPNHGTLKLPRFDFAVRIQGPIVDDIQATMQRMWKRVQGWAVLRERAQEGELGDAVKAARGLSAELGLGMRRGVQRMLGAQDSLAFVSAEAPRAQHDGVRAALLVRDNVKYRRRIESAYIAAVRSAKQEVMIANAYFLPGHALRYALAQAVKRGVKVSLLLQGRYEYFIQYHATHALYDYLLHQGMEVYEYSASFLHAKVAVVDSHWSTVGSSNLDPLSLLLAQEANIVVDDAAFATELRSALIQAQQTNANCLSLDDYQHRGLIMRALNWIAYGMFRLGVLFTGKNY
jgi:cardiolipin synthase A/B